MLATDDLPLRAQHIAHARDSKARNHQHECYYPLLKAVGEKVLWQQGEHGSELPLSQLRTTSALPACALKLAALAKRAAALAGGKSGAV